MDQFPEHIIETIFSYLIDRKYNYKNYTKNFITINQVRSVCWRFLNLEHHMVKNLVLGCHWSERVHHLSQNNHPFWQRNLPYIYHLTFWWILNKIEIDCSIFTHVKSLDISWSKSNNYKHLTQLKQIFCDKGYDVSELIKTNIHYHCCEYDGYGYLKYNDERCQYHGCLIRHDERCQYHGCLIRHDDPF